MRLHRKLDRRGVWVRRGSSATHIISSYQKRNCAFNRAQDTRRKTTTWPCLDGILMLNECCRWSRSVESALTLNSHDCLFSGLIIVSDSAAAASARTSRRGLNNCASAIDPILFSGIKKSNRMAWLVPFCRAIFSRPHTEPVYRLGFRIHSHTHTGYHEDVIIKHINSFRRASLRTNWHSLHSSSYFMNSKQKNDYARRLRWALTSLSVCTESERHRESINIENNFCRIALVV